MTRDELPHAIGVALVKARERIPREERSDYDGEAADIMPLIDQYVAAERERIAQAIEADYGHSPWIAGAARIARCMQSAS